MNSNTITQTPETGVEPTPESDNPFARRPRSRIARNVGILATAAMFGAAILGAWLLTRAPSEPPAAAGHTHGTVGAESAKPVMLTSDQARRIGVTYTTVSLGQLVTEIRTAAQVTYDETRVKSISPKLDGWIDQLYVNFTGQPVRRGDPLLAIYSPMFVAAEQELLLAGQLSKDMSGAAADARRGSTELRDAARRRLLYWDIAPDDIDRIERTGRVEKNVVLRAPVSGVIIDKNVLAGQKVMAGDALYKVADLSVVWVEGEVFERDLPSVRLGQTVRAEFQALPGETWLGRITYIYPTVNAETRTARVRVQLANSELRLKPGMYATIRIRGSSGAPVLSVPRSAVLATGERNLAFVKRPDGMLEPRYVTVGVATDERLQILSGLSTRDTIVASATFLVDAESNLGSALGGMGDMPGMELTAPTTKKSPK